MDSILVLRKWFNGLENAPDEMLDLLGGRIIKLLLGKEIDTSQDDWSYAKAWKDIEKDALGTYNAYQQKREYGQSHGKKMDPASVLTWQYCQDHPHANAIEVGEYLLSKGIDKRGRATKTKGIYGSIYDLDGWKQRKNSEWEFGKSSENSEQNSEEIERDSDGRIIF